MKLLKVFTCGGCGNSKFDSEFDEKGWCLKDSRGKDVAMKFNVDPSRISRIINHPNTEWKHVTI